MPNFSFYLQRDTITAQSPLLNVFHFAFVFNQEETEPEKKNSFSFNFGKGNFAVSHGYEK